MRFLAYHTKGLGRVVRHELQDAVPAATVTTTSPKYVVFECDHDRTPDLLALDTADDVHRLLAYRDHDQRPDADAVVEAVPVDRLAGARDLVGSIRDLEDTFSLTVSRYRNDDLDLDAVEDALAERIHTTYGWEYTPRDHSNVDVRVHVEEASVLASVRLTAKPLYYRDYRERGREGSLRPSIAAALVYLADPDPGDDLLDNFCGAGTILCEGVRQGLDVYGGDLDDEAVRDARANLRGLSRAAVRRVNVLDATDTALPGDRYDLAVSNVPWGEQLDLRAVDLYSQAIPEYARLLREDGRLVLLGPKPDLVEKQLRETFPGHTVGQFRLGFLGQRPWVSYALPEGASPNLA